ncbi:MAG: response regulator [Candidatus Aureabacteria bacterium]|nr:response regulator [Candidatus Auribacterota bacterium]
MNALLEKPLILFIDDDEDVLRTLKLCLNEDFQVLTAATPEEGLLLFKENHQDIKVVITDLKMPSMNGIELLKEIKHLDSQSVCLILSGRGDFEETVEAINRDLVYRYLQKPCDRDSLLETVHSAVKARRMNETLETVKKILAEEGAHLTQFYDQLILKGGTPLNFRSNDYSAGEIGRIKCLAEVGMVTLKIAHDIRNKLLILSLGMEGIETSLKKENFPAMFMNVVKKSISEISDLLEEIHFFVTQNGTEIHPAQIQVKNFISSCLPEIRSVFAEKEISVHLQIPEDFQIKMDSRLLLRLILNLAMNAAESMVKGDFIISAEEKDTTMELIFSDTGSRLLEQNLDDIFKPYATYKTGGSRIGLMNLKKTVELHGGTVRVESAAGKGIIFILSLPKEKKL